MTFYQSDSDLPDFNDYSMTNRTYRYFKGEPLYGFGYGLSYTTFKYSKLKLPANVTRGNIIPVTVSVTNTGNRDGEEIAELYVSYEKGTTLTPVRALKGIQRIHLKAGEKKQVNFRLTAEELAILDENGETMLPAGKMLVTVGGSQPDAATAASGKTVAKTIHVPRKKIGTGPIM